MISGKPKGKSQSLIFPSRKARPNLRSQALPDLLTPQKAQAVAGDLVEDVPRRPGVEADGSFVGWLEGPKEQTTMLGGSSILTHALVFVSDVRCSSFFRRGNASPWRFWPFR